VLIQHAAAARGHSLFDRWVIWRDRPGVDDGSPAGALTDSAADSGLLLIGANFYATHRGCGVVAAMAVVASVVTPPLPRTRGSHSRAVYPVSNQW